MNAAIRTLIEAAILAPSGDNTQPWRFRLDENDSELTIAIDESRDPSPMNAGQRMARIAIGAALENIVRTADANRWNVTTRIGDDQVYLGFIGSAPDRAGSIGKVIQSRSTNRRCYDRRTAPSGIECVLGDQVSADAAVKTYWITKDDRIRALAALIGRADEAMFGVTAMRQAFLAKVRFDAAATSPVAEGLSLASLELTRADRVALRLLRSLPPWAVRAAGIPRALRKKAMELVGSSSGVCVIVAEDRTNSTDFLVGRAMQQAWLALTELGFAAQPMMSLPVLDNVREHGRSGLVDGSQVEVFLQDLRTALPDIGQGRPAALLRFGYGSPPSGRTGRRSLDSVSEVAVTRREKQTV